MPETDAAACLFCRIRDGEVPGHVVLDEVDVLGFLDIRPVFPGHVLVIPRDHIETLPELPQRLVPVLFGAVQRLTVAVQEAMGADGAFVANNNVVSQSVPHLHVHVVPRRRKDGLRGFFWPRTKYTDDDEAAAVAARIAAAVPAGPTS